jgi:hypothetical protein
LRGVRYRGFHVIPFLATNRVTTRIWHFTCISGVVGHGSPIDRAPTAHHEEVPIMSLLTVLFKTAVWAARSAVLILTVMLFTVVLRFARKG